ncbi:hypothetical protein [Thalassospira mesophila]|uniref:hypothetical protein n=1 Tax=Thalassospira mesophila TaxID=1293891 RepID=UPI000A1FD458|nr:hypothetical protein [Thalassospira mesophila]
MLGKITICAAMMLGLAPALGPGTARAADSASYLDQVLSDALTRALGDFDTRVALEKETRETRRAEGDKLDVIRKTEIEAQWAAYEKAKAEKKQQIKLAEENDAKIKAAKRAADMARIDAIRNSGASNQQAQNNAMIMDAINRAANNVAQAEIQGRIASESAYATVNAINAARRAQADAEARLAAAQNAAAASAARNQAELARQQAEAARLAAVRASAQAAARQAATAQSTASSTTIMAGVVAGGANSALGSSGSQNTNIAFGGGTAMSPLAPARGAAGTAGNGNVAGSSGGQGPVSAALRDPVTRMETVAYCYSKQNTSPAFGDEQWFCDGPVQRTEIKNTLSQALEYVGCAAADIDHRREPYQQGFILFCEDAILPYDRDIAQMMTLPSYLLVRRTTYQCRDVARQCDASNAISVVAGHG